MASMLWLFSDRSSFVEAWQRAAGALGLTVQTAAPSDIAKKLSSNQFAALDGGSDAFDEDELLASACLVRSLQSHPIIVADPTRPMVDAGLLHELCDGLFAASLSDVDRIAQVVGRRADAQRRARFEYVTVSPTDGSLLALFGDGTSVSIARPAHAQDDRSDVVDILLGEDPSVVTIGLASNARFELRATNFSNASAASVTSQTPTLNGAPIPLEGVRLGARLRELRTAAGLTQAELARRTGIHRPNIARVEAGRHTPSLETLARLATAIGIPTTKLFADDQTV